MLRITFKYKDKYTRGQWQEQSCTMSSLKQCIEMYGLDEPDVEYEIISIKNIND